MQFWKIIFVAAAAVFAACQFIPAPQVRRAPPTPVGPSLVSNTEVESILHRSCEACHSSSVPLPWYGHVAPASWLVAKHVNRGIQKWDLAVWSERNPLRGEKEDMCDSVNDRSMPLPSYTWIHPGAKLSERDIEVLCNWAQESTSNPVAAK